MELALLLFASAFPLLGWTSRASTTYRDSFEMRLVATLPFEGSGRYVCGDADHDLRPEMYVTLAPLGTYALEHAGSNQFDTTYLGIWPQHLHWALGDLDRDGKADLVTQVEACSIYVIEATAAESLPRTVVWRDEVPLMPSAMRTVVADLDQDSLLEMYVRNEPEHTLRIYENRGPDQYVRLAEVPDRPISPAVTYDMDRDGRPEVIAGGYYGRVMFYEAVANDSFRCISMLMLSPTEENVNAVVAMEDMDGDGRPEAAAMFVDQHNVAVLAVYESHANDSFQMVWADTFFGGYFCDHHLAAGDIDGDSVWEFASTDGESVRVFHCIGNDRYQQVWSAEAWPGPVAIYDINADGKNELIFSGEGSTWTYIYQYCGSGLEEREQQRLEQAAGCPSVVRRGAAVRIGGLADGCVTVFDVAGKVTAKPTLGIWHTATATPGTYFVRITRGNQSITRKVLVVE